MRVLALLLLLLLQSAAPLDADLRSRFDTAQVPGITFVLAQGERLPSASIQPQARYGINWASAPDQVVPLRCASDNARVLLQTTTGQPLLLARGQTVVVAFETEGPIRRWLYFNYLLYCAASDTAGQAPLSFAKWPSAPVPGRRSQMVFGVACIGLWIIFSLCFRRAQRQGRARPEAAREFFLAVDAAVRKHNTHADPAVSEARQRWNQAGFARPLAGLLTLLSTMTFMVGIYFVIQWVLSNKVQPFPEADGLWRTTYDTLIVVAALFDAGSGIAGIKYFAEDRVARPAEALADFQFYIWWSFFQRLGQATLLGALAVWLLPASQFAIYAPFVLLFGFNGLPAIFQAGKSMCSALQRYDYQNLLDMLEQRVFFFLVPLPCILIGRSWGVAHPAYGEAFGAALGLGVGTLACNVAVLILGGWAVRRLGVPLGSVFLVQFDRRIAQKMLSFGGKITLGSEPIFLLKSVESVIIVKMMTDFTAWLGVHQLLTGRMLQLYWFTWMFFGGAVAALSESFSAGKFKLTQYYVARYLQFGTFIMAILFALMAAVGPVFVHSLGPQWDRAQPYLLLALLQGLLFTPVWISDQLQQGAGRPGLFLLTMGVEQGARLLLFCVLVPHFQFAGIFLATGLALIIKALFGWTLNHKRIVPLRILPWQTLGAPALTGLLIYGLWHGLLALWAPQSNAAVLVLLALSSAVSLFLGFFLCGLCGGFDRTALTELHQASDMGTFVAGIGRAMSQCAHLGVRLAPWRPAVIDIAHAAYQEAAELDRAALAGLG